MSPFAKLANVFAWIATKCVEVAFDLWASWVIPVALGNWFYNAGSWFFDVYFYFIEAASLVQDLFYRIRAFIRASDVLDIMDEFINLVTGIWGWFENWFANVRYVVLSWWEAVSFQVRGWINVAIQELLAFVEAAIEGLSGLAVWIDDFRTTILPGLINLGFWTSFWGAGIANIMDWWSPRRQEIRNELSAEVTPIRDKVNENTSWLEAIRDFIDDPGAFLLSEIEKMIVRFW